MNEFPVAPMARAVMTDECSEYRSVVSKCPVACTPEAETWPLGSHALQLQSMLPYPADGRNATVDVDGRTASGKR